MIVFCAVVFATVLLHFEVPAARTLLLADLRREVTLADPQISPDGSRIAVLVAISDYRHNNLRVRVDLVDVGTQHIRSLPLGLDSPASVRWSPDGHMLAFLALGKPNGVRQLFICSSEGQSIRQITTGLQEVQYFAWRPDGHAIAFVRADAPSAEKFHINFAVGDNDYLTTAKPKPSHLWLVGVSNESKESAVRLTSGSWSFPAGSIGLSQPYLDSFITPQHMPNQFFCWYNDSRQLAFTRMPDAYITHADRSVMSVLDTTSPTGNVQKLTSHAGLEAGCDISPDGTKLAYWYPSAGNAINSSAIFVTDAAARGTNGLEVTRNLDRSPWVVRWMPDNLSLLIIAHDGTREGMWRVGLDGDVRTIDIGDLSASGATVSKNGSIAFIASGPQTPTEVYVLPTTGARPLRLTSYNRYFWLLHLGKVAHVAWTYEGFRESGVLTYPPGFVAGKRYPLVLQIHGWPQYASQEAFDTDYPGLTQLFAAHGYLVFEPNYRGSDGAGNAFQTAIFRDTVMGPGRDILAGIAAVEKFGIVDDSKIGISGWSYGGLMTAWLITQDHRWKAAMTGGAPTDLVPDYAISNYNVLDRYLYGNALWSSKAAFKTYVDQSPLTYAWNVTTPTLIMASIYDTTVPITHSYEFYHALQERGVPVQFIAYVTSDHYPSDPISSEDVYRRWVGWFDRYLR